MLRKSRALCEAKRKEMAIYHLSVKPVQRSKGRSATAAAAYRAGIRIADERTGEIHDYRKKGGVNFSEILTPDGSRIDRAQLWNMAEASEKRKDGTTAREYEIALPAELDAESRKELALEFGRMILKRHGVAVDISIHAPTEKGDQRNHHAHVMATTRKFEGGKLTGKSDFDLSDRDRKKKNLPGRKHELEVIREEWAAMVNRALARANQKERVTHTSLKAQGISRPPTIHLGPAATAMERREELTERGERNREIAKIAPTMNELDMLKKQQRGIAEARTRFENEKITRMKKAAEEKQEREENEMEILEEGAGERARESRARIRDKENQTSTFDQRNHERDGAKKAGEIESQIGSHRLVDGSDTVAGRYAPDKFGIAPTESNWRKTERGNRSNLEEIGYEGSGNFSTEKRPKRDGEISPEHSGSAGRTISQRETGSIKGGSGSGGSDRENLGGDQKFEKENRFIAKIIELEKQILKLAAEYKNIADLLAMTRKDGGQRHQEQDGDKSKSTPSTRLRA